MQHAAGKAWHLLWPACVAAVVGIAVSVALAIALHRNAIEMDDLRFAAEVSQATRSLEQTMERYEERLSRLADLCAQFPLVDINAWSFKRHTVVDVGGNLPNVIHLVYCPKIVAADFESHRQLGNKVRPEGYQFDTSANPGPVALPAWQVYTRSGFEPIAAGTDFSLAADGRPSFLEALPKGHGWMSPNPVTVNTSDGGRENGVWFVLGLFKPDQPATRWLLKGETVPVQEQRLADFNAEVSLGVLAAFISMDRMVDGNINNEGRPRHLHARLYATREPMVESRLNPKSTAPSHPRHRAVSIQAWYGRRWALELTSTPLFEQESQRFRAWLAAGVGMPVSLLVAAFIGYQSVMRGREREAALALAESRDALRNAQAEREKLSRDLHDGAIQSLYSLQLGLMNTAKRIPESAPESRAELAATRTSLDGVIAELRQFILHQKPTDGNGRKSNLCDVLHSLAARPRINDRSQVLVECEPVIADRLDAEQSIQLANIAREALSNALRHGRASRVVLRLAAEDGLIRMEIEDDGRGFDPQRAAKLGLGLATMESRAEEAGGSFAIVSQTDQGATVLVRVPRRDQGKGRIWLK